MAMAAPLDWPMTANDGCADGVRDAEHVARVVARAVRARSGHLAAPAAAQVDRHQLQRVAGEPFGEAVEAAQVRRQAGHAHHRWRIRGTPPPHPKPSGRERDVAVLVSHGVVRHVGTLLRTSVRPRIARR